MIQRTLRALSIPVALALAIARPSPALAGGPPGTTLRVFAAASLVDAFSDLKKSFEAAHPGTSVQLNLAGSQQLAAQIEQGAAADVFASADQRWMDYARDHGLLASPDTAFAFNRLVVIVPRSNPARIRRLQDLGRRGVRLVLGAEEVPVGLYSRRAIANLAKLPDFDPQFARHVIANLASEEDNVKSVVGKVQLGEADAGMVYRSDLTPMVERYVLTFEIPDRANVLARYPIAIVKGARAPEAARDFIALVLSPAGQGALEARHFVPAAPATP